MSDGEMDGQAARGWLELNVWKGTGTAGCYVDLGKMD